MWPVKHQRLLCKLSLFLPPALSQHSYLWWWQMVFPLASHSCCLCQFACDIHIGIISADLYRSLVRPLSAPPALLASCAQHTTVHSHRSPKHQRPDSCLSSPLTVPHHFLFLAIPRLLGHSLAPSEFVARWHSSWPSALPTFILHNYVLSWFAAHHELWVLHLHSRQTQPPCRLMNSLDRSILGPVLASIREAAGSQV